MTRHTVGRILVGGLLLGFGVAAGNLIRADRPVLRLQWPQIDHELVVRRTDAQMRGGPEYVLVYIGSSRCFFSRLEDTRHAVRAAVSVLDDTYRELGMRYTSVGVALDWDTGAGERHLARILAFDEESSGRFWLNSSLMLYATMANGAQPGTPQLILLRRVVQVPDESGVLYDIDQEEVLATAVGIGEVMAFPKKIQAVLRELRTGVSQ